MLGAARKWEGHECTKKNTSFNATLNKVCSFCGEGNKCRFSKENCRRQKGAPTPSAGDPAIGKKTVTWPFIRRIYSEKARDATQSKGTNVSGNNSTRIRFNEGGFYSWKESEKMDGERQKWRKDR